MFTEKEIAYINSKHLARLATVSKSMQTDVAPVGFKFDGKTFFITGFDITKTFKYKNIKASNELVSLVIDDLASIQPWVARGVKVHGTAQIVAGGAASLIIYPHRSWSWGIEDIPFKNGKPVSNKTKHN